MTTQDLNRQHLAQNGLLPVKLIKNGFPDLTVNIETMLYFLPDPLIIEGKKCYLHLLKQNGIWSASYTNSYLEKLDTVLICALYNLWESILDQGLIYPLELKKMRTWK